jgi:hypothetical protein
LRIEGAPAVQYPTGGARGARGTARRRSNSARENFGCQR